MDIARRDGRKFHMCPVCGKEFGWSSNLRRHLRVHTGTPTHAFRFAVMVGTIGERPYNCRHCNASFTNSSNRNKHERTHAKDDGKPKNEDSVPGASEEDGDSNSKLDNDQADINSEPGPKTELPSTTDDADDNEVGEPQPEEKSNANDEQVDEGNNKSTPTVAVPSTEAPDVESRGSPGYVDDDEDDEDGYD